jgi:hypothetical protein
MLLFPAILLKIQVPSYLFINRSWDSANLFCDDGRDRIKERDRVPRERKGDKQLALRTQLQDCKNSVKHSQVYLSEGFLIKLKSAN